MQLVLVSWRDAEAQIDWQRVDDIQISQPIVYSLGWLVKETKEVIIIAADLAPGERGLDINRRLEVPKGMIEKMVKVQLKTAKGTFDLMPKKPKKPVKPRKPY